MQPKASEVLKRAREKLDAGWTQGAYARDESGKVVDFVDPLAKSFCLIGAYRSAAVEMLNASKTGWWQDTEPGRFIVAKIGTESGVLWNDRSERTKEEVLELLDQTIANALEQEGIAEEPKDGTV